MKGDRFYTNLQSSTPGVGNLTSCRLVAEQIQLPIARHTPSRCRLSPRPIPPTPPCAIRLTVCLSVCSSFFPFFDFESCGGEANKSKTRNDERTAGPRTTAFFASARAASSCWTLYCTRLATARTRRRRTDGGWCAGACRGGAADPAEESPAAAHEITREHALSALRAQPHRTNAGLTAAPQGRAGESSRRRRRQPQIGQRLSSSGHAAEELGALGQQQQQRR